MRWIIAAAEECLLVRDRNAKAWVTHTLLRQRSRGSHIKGNPPPHLERRRLQSKWSCHLTDVHHRHYFGVYKVGFEIQGWWNCAGECCYWSASSPAVTGVARSVRSDRNPPRPRSRRRLKGMEMVCCEQWLETKLDLYGHYHDSSKVLCDTFLSTFLAINCFPALGGKR